MKPIDPGLRCSAQVHNGGLRVTFHRCTRKATVMKEGVCYCKQHDPDAVAKRRATSEENWKKWHKEEMKKVLGPAFLETLRKVCLADSLEEARSIASAMIAKYERT